MMNSIKNPGVIVSLVFSLLMVAPSCRQPVGEEQAGEGRSRKAVPIEISPVEIMTFENIVSVQGDLEAKNYANVSARVPGSLDAIYVDEGDFVIAGRTKLFEVDSVNLKSALKIAKQDLEVARCAVREAQSGLEQVDAELKKVKTDMKRLENLYEKEVVSKDALEQVQTGYEVLVATQKNILSVIDLTRERRRQAEIGLEISEKNLSDATIYAPVTGHIAIKFLEAGEMAAPGMPVIRIEDTSTIEASAFIPSEYYSLIEAGETIVNLTVSGIELAPRTVSYVSPTVNPKMRVFEVKSIIKDPPHGVVPGAIVNFDVVLESRRSPGVPSDCLQMRAGKEIVFMAAEGKSVSRSIKTGLETDGYTEVLEGGLSAGEMVVTQGQNFIESGTLVELTGEEK